MKFRKSKLTKKQRIKLLEHFVAGATARTASEIVGVNKNTGQYSFIAFSLPSYDILDVSEFKHVRINHSKLFAQNHDHINGIENFWNQAKRHMRKFNGIPKKNFRLFLKECEWRFNFPSPKKQLNMLTKWAELDK